ncbi:MAG: hypothetical protein OEY14_08890, partial [Myxococcales bacterium]|nr:hypothetical protein [Myxococcales bacterium]
MTHSDRFPTRRAPLLSVLLALIASIGCGGGDLPSGWASSPAGSGPRIVWDLAAEPLPEIPLPNDLATWPDPTSPTGLRINASMVAPTEMEETTRSYFDELDGWSVQAPITMAFEAPIDVERLIDAQGGARFDGIDWPRHAIYLVNLETGVPVPIEINGGNFHFALRDTRAYWDNDSRAGESNIFFETVEEDRDGDGVLDPGEDTDFDGVLDHPNTIDGALIDPSDPTETVDRLLWFYERETNTLIMRPIMPLAPRTQYAMVVTNRLVGEGGSPVRSPFDQVHHVGQYEALAGLKSIFDAHPEIYGGLDWPGVAFAWTFTTQSTTEDLWTLREGLYGRGSMAHLAEAFPPHFLTAEARRGNASFPCDPGARSYTVTMDEIRPVLDTVGQEAFGVSATQMAELLATYDNVSHFVVGYVETPYLLGDPKADHPYERWRFDRQTGEARLDRDRIPVIVTVPKETPEYQQPFPVVFYGHGYTSMMIESIGFAGLMARHGLATVGIDAQAHGLGMDAILESVLTNVFAGACLDGMGEMIKTDRAIDHNGDGIKDSAGIYWSAYVFHTRDVTRQSVLDHMQVIRTFRHFGGRPGEEPPLWEPAEIIPENPRAEPLRFSGDVDGDGERDLAGDFDGDGRIDFGGWDNQYYAWGQSLGGILSG